MEEPEEIQTFAQKLLFYTTAFFVLLGTFSLFAFLFLVPFVIEPAFTTIFMEFEPVAALCVTSDTETRHGASNCSWASCREGCTKEVYECTQIRVNYKKVEGGGEAGLAEGDEGSMDDADKKLEEELHEYLRTKRSIRNYEFLMKNYKQLRSLVVGDRPARVPRGLQEYDFSDEDGFGDDMTLINEDELPPAEPTGLMPNTSEWFYVGAKLFPNVKGCGYPPMLNCSIFLKQYMTPGTNFSCYFSQVDPGLVINHLDMDQVYMNLVYAMAIPIPSFIASVIYLTFAYFKIYTEDEEEALVNTDGDGGEVEADGVTPVPPLTSGAITPGSEIFREDLVSFGHQLKVAMADEMSRESVADVINSNSIPGNLSKMMTTSISTPPGPIAQV